MNELPPEEQRQRLADPSPWSGEKLTDHEKKMFEANDAADVQELKEQIVGGFFGDQPRA